MRGSEATISKIYLGRFMLLRKDLNIVLGWPRVIRDLIRKAASRDG